MFKSKGACEYNLAIFTPAPDHWQKLSPERIELWKQELSRVKQDEVNAEGYMNPSSVAFNKRYEDFLMNSRIEDVLSSYKEHKNILKIVKEFSTSYRIINKILEDNNVEKEDRTLVGYIRSEQERLTISNKARKRLGLDLIEELKKCSVCSKILEPHSKTVLCIEHYKEQRSAIPEDKKLELIELIKKKLSIREMSRITGVSKTKIRKFMVDNGYEIPKQSADAAHKAQKGIISPDALFIDCLTCGKTVRSKQKSPGRVRKYCSVECRGIASRKKN